MSEIHLRPVCADDLEPLSSRDDEEIDFFGHRSSNGLARRFAADGLVADDSGMLAVESEGHSLIGAVAWHAVQHGPLHASRCLNIGITLLSEYRGRGYGTAAQLAFGDYLFRTLPIERLEAGTDSENVAEQRALEKAGFHQEGVLRHAQYRLGRWRDVILYSRLRNDALRG